MEYIENLSESPLNPIFFPPAGHKTVIIIKYTDLSALPCLLKSTGSEASPLELDSMVLNILRFLNLINSVFRPVLK